MAEEDFLEFGVALPKQPTWRKEDYRHLAWSEWLWNFSGLLSQRGGTVPSSVGWCVWLWLLYNWELKTCYLTACSIRDPSVITHHQQKGTLFHKVHDFGSQSATLTRYRWKGTSWCKAGWLRWKWKCSKWADETPTHTNTHTHTDASTKSNTQTPL